MQQLVSQEFRTDAAASSDIDCELAGTQNSSSSSGFQFEDSMQDLGKEIEITICTSCTECRIGRSRVESIPGRERPSYPWHCR
jgi:hypothetical protein